MFPPPALFEIQIRAALHAQRIQGDKSTEGHLASGLLQCAQGGHAHPRFVMHEPEAFAAFHQEEAQDLRRHDCAQSSAEGQHDSESSV